MASTSSNTALVIEPVVDKVKRWKRGKGDILRELPPPPLAKNLSTPLVRKKANIMVLAEAVIGMMPMEGMLVVEVDKVARGWRQRRTMCKISVT